MAKNTGLSYENLDTAFRHQNFEPLYFLFGEEPFLIQELQQTLIEHALAPEERDFNYDLVYGQDTDAQAVLALCAAYPVMAQRRLVIVRNFEQLANNRLFKNYAEQPNPHAIVLLACSGKPNLSAHPYRALKQHAAWGRFKALYDNQMPGWIKKRLQRLGYQIEPQAVQMLADYVGTDLQSAAGEIEKLITFSGKRQRLTADDVLRASGQTREFNVFELQGAIGEGRFHDAVRIAGRLVQQASNGRGEGIRIVAILTTYFMRLQRLGVLQGRGASKRDMARQVGINPYFISEYLVSLRRFSPRRLEQAFAALLAADYELKGGSTRDARLVLLLLLRRLIPESVREASSSA
jgi:DNA polymerase-3 subunit delta